MPEVPHRVKLRRGSKVAARGGGCYAAGVSAREIVQSTAHIARAFGPLARFALGAPLIDPTHVALHRGLARGSMGDGSGALIADVARTQQVAVLASETIPGLRAHLKEAVARERRVDALLELGLADAARVLRDGPPVALLKGSAAAAWVYPETAWRTRKDIDLLVGEGLPAVRQVLLANGWRDATDPRASQDVGAARAWPVAREIGNTTISIDLHRGLVHSDWCRPRVDRMLADRVAGRASLPVTNVADTLLHTALHLVGTGFHEPLKGWVDVLRLVALVAPEDLAERARLHRVETIAWTCLGVVGRWFGASVADHRRALTRPLHGAVIDHLLAGEHATPERNPLPRGAAYRLWRVLARDL